MRVATGSKRPCVMRSVRSLLFCEGWRAFLSPWVVWPNFWVELEQSFISWDVLPRLCNVTFKTKQTCCSTTSVLFFCIQIRLFSYKHGSIGSLPPEKKDCKYFCGFTELKKKKVSLKICCEPAGALQSLWKTGFIVWIKFRFNQEQVTSDAIVLYRWLSFLPTWATHRLLYFSS